MTVVFFGTKMSAHVPPVGLWESYARICRWMRLADPENDLG